MGLLASADFWAAAAAAAARAAASRVARFSARSVADWRPKKVLKTGEKSESRRDPVRGDTGVPSAAALSPPAPGGESACCSRGDCTGVGVLRGEEVINSFPVVGVPGLEPPSAPQNIFVNDATMPDDPGVPRGEGCALTESWPDSVPLLAALGGEFAVEPLSLGDHMAAHDTAPRLRCKGRSSSRGRP